MRSDKNTDNKKKSAATSERPKTTVVAESGVSLISTPPEDQSTAAAAIDSSPQREALVAGSAGTLADIATVAIRSSFRPAMDRTAEECGVAADQHRFSTKDL